MIGRTNAVVGGGELCDISIQIYQDAGVSVVYIDEHGTPQVVSAGVGHTVFAKVPKYSPIMVDTLYGTGVYAEETLVPIQEIQDVQRIYRYTYLVTGNGYLSPNT